MGNCICRCFRRGLIDRNQSNAETETKILIEEPLNIEDSLRENEVNTLSDEKKKERRIVKKVIKPVLVQRAIIERVNVAPPPQKVQTTSNSSNAPTQYTTALKMKMLQREAEEKRQVMPENSQSEGDSFCIPTVMNENIVNYRQILLQDEEIDRVEVDTRIKNDKSQSYPYNCIGLIVGKLPSGDKTYTGTGFLISSDLVLTVAHNLFSRSEMRDNRDIRFYPKLHGKIENNEEERFAMQWRVNDKYKQTGKVKVMGEDYALIRLDQPVQRDRYIMIGQDYPKLATAEIFGYPWDVNNQEKRIYHQFGGKGEIVSFDNDSLLYRIDTMGGQSGSPVVVEFVKGLYFVVGIHAHFRNLEQLNCGVHLKNAKVDVIRSWIEELSPESRYNIINFKEIRELPQYNIQNGGRLLEEIDLYLQQIEHQENIHKVSDKLRWLYVQTAKKYRLRGNYEAALNFLEKAEVACKELYVEEGEQLACILNERGSIISLQKNYLAAIQVYQRSLSIFEKIGKAKDEAIVLSNIGNCYNYLKKLKKAEKYYSKSLIIKEQLFGKDSDKLATHYTNFAAFLMKVNKYEQAEQLYRKVLKIKQEKVMHNTQELPRHYFNLALCLCTMGKIEDSFTNHFKAIELMIELKLTSHDRFKKFLKTFKMTIDQALNKGIKKELMVEVYSMMSKLIEYDESMIEMMERLKRDIQQL